MLVLKYLQYIFDIYEEVKLFNILVLKSTNYVLTFLLMRKFQRVPASMELEWSLLTQEKDIIENCGFTANRYVIKSIM